MAKIRIAAYTDRISVKAGDTLSVMASADATETVHALELVRLIHGDETSRRSRASSNRKWLRAVEREWPVRQAIRPERQFPARSPMPGKRDWRSPGAFTLHAFIFPTQPAM